MENEKNTDGAFFGLMVIIIILIVGGIYVWQSKVKQLEKLKLENAAQESANLAQ